MNENLKLRYVTLSARETTLSELRIFVQNVKSSFVVMGSYLERLTYNLERST